MSKSYSEAAKGVVAGDYWHELAFLVGNGISRVVAV